MTAAAVVLVCGGGMLAWFQPWKPDFEPASVEKMAFPLPAEPSIAVLPFTNLSGSPDDEYLADGLVDNIITALSKNPDLFVIARNSTFTYKGRAVPISQVAEEHGVRYVVEGSFQRSGERIRVNAQLIDALGGHHVWAEKYDRVIDDFFATQDDITDNIMVALQVEGVYGEGLRTQHARAPTAEAFEYLVKAQTHYDRYTKEDNAITIELTTKAAKISPEYPDPWVTMGWAYLANYRFGWGGDREEAFQNAVRVAEKAEKLDPLVAKTKMLLASLKLYRGQYDEAIAYARAGVKLAPSEAEEIGTLAWMLTYSGSPGEAIPLLKKAIRLMPYYPAWITAVLGLAYMMTGDYPNAIAAHEQLIERESFLQFAYARLAEIHATMGDHTKAKEYASELLKIVPDFTISDYANALIYKNEPDHCKNLEESTIKRLA
jgi:adenylate cyclase